MSRAEIPAELARAMRAALTDNENPRAMQALEAAEHLLDKVLLSDCDSRDAALDLLTVDALVTRSMEAAARDPALMKTFPEQAMQRIAKKGIE
jgi:hypothetical protein